MNTFKRISSHLEGMEGVKVRYAPLENRLSSYGTPTTTEGHGRIGLQFGILIAPAEPITSLRRLDEFLGTTFHPNIHAAQRTRSKLGEKYFSFPQLSYLQTIGEDRQVVSRKLTFDPSEFDGNFLGEEREQELVNRGSPVWAATTVYAYFNTELLDRVAAHVAREEMGPFDIFEGPSSIRYRALREWDIER